jgi:putative nucleotidyltransferase with HDIG domain
LSFATRVFGLATLSIAAVGIPLALLGDSSIPPQGRWLLVVVGAAGFALLIARFAEREVAALVRRLAEATSALSTDGEPWRGYVGAREGREVRELERAFHNLVEAVELSHRARERSYVEAVGAVVAAVDARDHEITGHSIRVARYAVAVARAMGIDDPATLRAMEWGALLHDVGKIAVPDAILRKAGPLTEDELHIMRQHPSWGYEILADVRFLKPALAIVYSHHERWDGQGYPRGLAGDQIPLTARIFAVVDAYDAITSDRPYRRAGSHTAAVAELLRVAGSQLDPQVIEAFLGISEVELRRMRDLRSREAGFGLMIDDPPAAAADGAATGGRAAG